jgi:hypothetical protein
MRTLLVAVALVLATALPARAQAAGPAHRSLGEGGPRLADLRLPDLSGRTGPILQDPVDDPKQDDDEGTRDSLRNGTLTGLVVGGIVGAFLAAQCGHPECRSLVRADPAGPRRAPFDRAVVVGLKKKW